MKALYYILSCTWGAIMTLIGGIIALALLITGRKPYRHAGSIYFKVGKSWGGLELGLFFLTDSKCPLSTRQHEFGHSLQNCIWGPAFPFVVCLPSAARYWLRKMKTMKSKILYSSSFLLIGFILFIVSLIVTVLVHPLFLMMSAFCVYIFILGVWLTFFESPKYQKKYVPYDSIWFEGQATKWGKNHSAYWNK